MHHLDPCSVLEAELWGIYHGISVARGKSIDNLIIELDCLKAFELLTTRNYHGHDLQYLVRGILDFDSKNKNVSWKKIDHDVIVWLI